MDPVQKLRDQRVALIEQSREVMAEAKADDRELTDEEVVVFEANLTKIDELKAQVERVEKVSDLSSRLDGAKASLDVPERRQTAPDTPDASPGQPHIRVGKVRLEDDPTKGFKSPKHFIMDVMHHATRDYRNVQNADGLKILAAVGSDEQATFKDSLGGFLVPEAFIPRVLQLEPEGDPMGALTTKIPMESSTIVIPARVDKNHSSSVSGGLTVARKEESTAAVTSKMSLEQVRMTATSLFGVSYVTEELLTDSFVSFAAILQAGFSDEFTSHIIDERINGTGVGEFEGVLTSPALITITAEPSQVATTLVYENLVKMRARCWRYSKAIWIANHDTLPQLMTMTLAVGTGGQAMWQQSAREDAPDMLFGRPIFFTEYAKTLGTAGDIILGVWSEYLEGTLQNLQSAESIHVRFLEHERTFKFWLRNAGACWWRSAFTPKNGSTLSPFVDLATRA